MDFSFFISDNKSGYKTQEKWFSTHYPDDYNEILNYAKEFNIDLTFKEKIWFFYNKLTERPKCITCGGEIKFRNRFDKPYGEFCSLNCINSNKNEMIKRQKNTFNQKYNVDFFPLHKDFIKKQRKTKLERYNNENYNNLSQAKKTKLERYNNENYINSEKYKITCIKKYGVDNYSKSNNYRNQIVKSFKSSYPDVNFIDVEKFIVKIECNKCGKISEITKQLLYERNKRGYSVCTHCNPIGQSNRSGYETELSKYLTELSIKHECSYKSVLGKQEIDVFIPEYNIAIEFDGVYWHNELFLTSDYHLKKTIGCLEKNIELIHIFEDEWVYKQDIVKSIIKNRLKKTDNSIFARKCVIKEINSPLCTMFLNENHIQGNVNSKVRIGLYYQNRLVSVMTFSKGRVLMGGKFNEWELTRFCNEINVNVIGAAGKLLKYFIKKYNPTKMVSYSDIRLFNGNMYESLGFKRISQSSPNYWYVINGLRYHRFNFRKSVLVKEGFDKYKTEKQIMFDRKIYRIYDCGHIRWEYNIL
jgi:hypothetical protein